MKIINTNIVFSLISCMTFAVFAAAPPAGATSNSAPAVDTETIEEYLVPWWQLLHTMPGGVVETLAQNYLDQEGNTQPSIEDLETYFNKDKGRTFLPGVVQRVHQILHEKYNSKKPITFGSEVARYTGDTNEFQEALRADIDYRLREQKGSYVIIDLSEKDLDAMSSEDLLQSIQAIRAHVMSMGCYILELNLDDNNLTSLPVGLFNGFHNLQKLSLYNNRLEDLPAGIFSGLHNLYSLGLAHNQLANLLVGTFSSLHNLLNLDLAHNQLTNLPIGIFDGLQNLQWLWLGRNQLEDLPLGIFRGLHHLQNLDLTRNQLTILHANIFDGLHNLEVLRLMDNPIVYDAGALQQIQQQVPRAHIRIKWRQ